MIGLNRYTFRSTSCSIKRCFPARTWPNIENANKMWITDISSSSSTAASSSSSSSKDQKTSSSVQEDFLTKYFSSQISIDSDTMATSLSPSILDSMLSESLTKADVKTTMMLVSQAVSLGDQGITTIEKTLQHCLQTHDFIQAAKILQCCDPKAIPVSNVLCNNLLGAAINHYHWDSSFIIIAYMLLHQMKISERAVFYVTGGLMTETSGVVKVLELIRLIIECKREDLAKMFSFSKMNQFALSLGGNKAFRRQNIEAALESVMGTWLVACQKDDFTSFSLAKMITSIARAAKLQDLAASFAK